MRIYLGKDPETGRISAQERSFIRDRDLPYGISGEGWEHRWVEVEDWVWKNLLMGLIPYDKQDELHLHWWDQGLPTNPMAPRVQTVDPYEDET